MQSSALNAAAELERPSFCIPEYRLYGNACERVFKAAVTQLPMRSQSLLNGQAYRWNADLRAVLPAGYVVAAERESPLSLFRPKSDEECGRFSANLWELPNRYNPPGNPDRLPDLLEAHGRNKASSIRAVAWAEQSNPCVD
jgi:hypothetical protein